MQPLWLEGDGVLLRLPSQGELLARGCSIPTVQHGGVIVGLGAVAGHWYCEKPGDRWGAARRANRSRR